MATARISGVTLNTVEKPWSVPYCSVDGKHPGQLFHPIHDPAAPVLEVLAGETVFTAQKSAAHTAADDVIPQRVGKGNERGTGSRHDIRLDNWDANVKTKWVSFCFRGAVVKGQQRTPVGGQLDQALMLFVRERRVQHFLQRLDLARQAAVLAVDEHGDQGWIWLGDGENSFSSLP